MPVSPTTGAPIPGLDAQTKALAKHAYQTAMSSLKDQRQDTLSYYGFMQRNGGVRYDPRNPYGALQVMQRGQGQQMQQLYGAQSQAGLQVMGQSQRGLGRQQGNQARFQFGLDEYGLRKEMQDKLQAITRGMSEAKWVKNRQVTTGTLQAIISAINSGAFTPAAPISGNYGYGG